MKIQTKELCVTSEIWLTVDCVSELLGISARAVRKACKNGKYHPSIVNGNGGAQYKILLNSLPLEAQYKYYKSLDENRSSEETAVTTIQNKADNKQQLTTDQRETALARFDLVDKYRKVCDLQKNKLRAKMKFIEDYNSGEIFQELFKKLGETSYKTIERWKKNTYRQQ